MYEILMLAHVLPDTIRALYCMVIIRKKTSVCIEKGEIYIVTTSPSQGAHPILRFFFLVVGSYFFFERKLKISSTYACLLKTL